MLEFGFVNYSPATAPSAVWSKLLLKNSRLDVERYCATNGYSQALSALFKPLLETSGWPSSRFDLAELHSFTHLDYFCLQQLVISSKSLLRSKYQSLLMGFYNTLHHAVENRASAVRSPPFGRGIIFHSPETSPAAALVNTNGPLLLLMP